MSPFDRWREGPYAMQAIVGCAIEDKPGSWFIQLRTPADDLFDQVVLCSGTGGPTREDAISKVAAYDPDISEVIEWDRPMIVTPVAEQYLTKAYTPPPKMQLDLFDRKGLLAVLASCREEIDKLCKVINLQHDEI